MRVEMQHPGNAREPRPVKRKGHKTVFAQKPFCLFALKLNNFAKLPSPIDASPAGFKSGGWMDAIHGFPFTLCRSLGTGPEFRIGGGDWVYRKTDAGVFEHAASGLRIQVREAVQEHHVLCRRLQVLNTGDQPVAGIDFLDPLFLKFNQPLNRWRLIHAHGGTTEDFHPPLAYQTRDQILRERPLILRSHPDGRSSNLHLPLLTGLVSTDPEAEGFFCGLEWSGTWHITMEACGPEQSRLAVGVMVRDLRLAPGESLDLPAVHLGFFRGGPDAATNALRRYLYEQVCPPYDGHPCQPRVSYDHWYGFENAVNDPEMRRQAKAAAEIGVETFVVDASWFPGDYPPGAGNWERVDPAKFPDGLQPLAEYVRSLGMDFGLWFEPEHAIGGSDILRDHPEWFVRSRGWIEELPSYHLNLALREAQDWVIEMVGGWISRLDLRWSRWDYNIEAQPVWDALDPSGKIQFAYYKGLYRVLDTLMKEHPLWMVEACASGGRRLDIGTMRRAHTYWFSDHSDHPQTCRHMQLRANRFLPGHLLNSSVAVRPGKRESLFDDHAVLSRMAGKLAFDGDVASWGSERRARMRQWTEVFKAGRHLLSRNFFPLFPLPGSPEDWDAAAFVDYTGREALVFVFSGCLGGSRSLPLRGLAVETTFRLRRLPDGESFSCDASKLIRSGLEVTLEADCAALWHLCAELPEAPLS